MKNATAYEKKVKKLLSGMDRSAAAPADEQDAAWVLVRAVFEADAWPALADPAVEALRREFVDANELRVAPPKDIVECVGREFPRIRDKALQVTEVLNEIYRRQNRINTEYLAAMAKRELRRHLQELGLEPFAAALVTLRAFGGHAVAVDETLIEVLKMDDLVHADSDAHDVQGFLERIIPQKDADAAHAFLRDYVRANAARLEKKRKEEAARAEAERKKAEKEAAEKARREEEAARKADAAAKKAKKAKAAKKAKKTRKAKKAKTAAKAKTAKKPARKKTAKRPARKSAKSARKPKAKAKTARSGKKPAKASTKQARSSRSAAKRAKSKKK